MEVSTKTVENVTVVTLSGDLDGKTAPVAREVISPLCQNACKIVLDMSQVAYMSSAGLRLMLLLHRQATGAQGQMVLVGLSDDLKGTMSATGFLSYFTTADTLDTALATLR